MNNNGKETEYLHVKPFTRETKLEGKTLMVEDYEFKGDHYAKFWPIEPDHQGPQLACIIMIGDEVYVTDCQNFKLVLLVQIFNWHS